MYYFSLLLNWLKKKQQCCFMNGEVKTINFLGIINVYYELQKTKLILLEVQCLYKL